MRGYITGSAWESYKKTGEVNGEKLKEGLRESEMLERAIWTPSTKAEVGGKDENISREEGEFVGFFFFLRRSFSMRESLRWDGMRGQKRTMADMATAREKELCDTSRRN